MVGGNASGCLEHRRRSASKNLEGGGGFRWAWRSRTALMMVCAGAAGAVSILFSTDLCRLGRVAFLCAPLQSLSPHPPPTKQLVGRTAPSPSGRNRKHLVGSEVPLHSAPHYALTIPTRTAGVFCSTAHFYLKRLVLHGCTAIGLLAPPARQNVYKTD